MRNSTDNKKAVTKNDKTSSVQDPVDIDTETKSNKLQNGSDTKQWNGRQVVMAKSARRVVIPPRQKPLVVIENDEEEPHELCEQVNKSKNKKMALVTGLPPGMTEARLLSLCGPEVEVSSYIKNLFIYVYICYVKSCIYNILLHMYSYGIYCLQKLGNFSFSHVKYVV